MCGITGFFDTAVSEMEKRAIGDKMLKRISHRGPDATKSYVDDNVFLGHNRLSIIDLSTEADQPFMVDHMIMVYNGEVYNYVEIRGELEVLGHTFRTASDTEVIIKSYIQWGENCVERFVGMWSFVMYNKNTGELFCSRDRFGIKPFYYIHTQTGFYFASEVKAFYDLSFFDKKLNFKQVARGLNLGWITYRDETYFDQVKALEPAQNMIVLNNNLSLKTYWKLNQNPQSCHYTEAVDIFRKKFLESVSIHMRSDVKVGVCLSGGIDSSSIVSAISKNQNTSIDSFTIYYDGKDEVDERPWVYEVLKSYPNIKPHFFTPSDAEIREHFSHILYHQDAPLPGSSPVSQYFLMQLAAQNRIKVVLDGQGSDEYLLGYMHFYYSIYAYLLKKGKLITFYKTLKTHKKTQHLSLSKTIEIVTKSFAKWALGEQIYKKKEFKSRYEDVLNYQIKSDVWSSFDNGNPIDSVTQNALFQDVLPTLLYFEDRNSMAFSIESRVPFLDHRLVEFAYNLPYQFKLNDGITKRILRDALEGILPEKIAKRTDKKGFVTPGEVKWLRGPLKDLLDFNRLTHLGDICDMDKVKSLLEKFNIGDNSNAPLVWRLIALNEWRKGLEAS